jgi:hypothetical protein
MLGINIGSVCMRSGMLDNNNSVLDEASGEGVRSRAVEDEGAVSVGVCRGVVASLKENLYHWEL